MIWILFIGTMAISLLAMMMLKMAYAKYSKLPASSGLTGAEVAQRI
jgi:Zn-dependent membrane protease YugP